MKSYSFNIKNTKLRRTLLILFFIVTGAVMVAAFRGTSAPSNVGTPSQQSAAGTLQPAPTTVPASWVTLYPTTKGSGADTTDKITFNVTNPGGFAVIWGYNCGTSYNSENQGNFIATIYSVGGTQVGTINKLGNKDNNTSYFADADTGSYYIEIISECNWVIRVDGHGQATSANPPPATIVSAQSTNTIIGFGATLADWNNNHTADTRYATNAAYDPDPNINTSITAGGNDDRYTAVSFQEGRALQYTMNLPDSTSIAKAKTEAMKEFPKDAKILWFVNKGQCSAMEVQSKTLGAALTDPQVGDSQGMANLEFSTVDSSGYAEYNPNNINNILVGLGAYASPSDENPGC